MLTPLRYPAPMPISVPPEAFTLCFVCSPDQLLLVRVAPHKRLFAGRLNALGGRVEAGETPARAACREVREEAGLELAGPSLRALLHQRGRDGQNRLLFVFRFDVDAPSQVRGSEEGEVDWYPLAALPQAELVPDLPPLLELALADGEVRLGESQLDPDSGALGLSIR